MILLNACIAGLFVFGDAGDGVAGFAGFSGEVTGFIYGIHLILVVFLF